MKKSKHPITTPSFVPSDLRARFSAYNTSDNFSPYMSDGDSARVLFFSNLSDAYDGFKGQHQALFDLEYIANAVSFYAANAKGSIILKKTPAAKALLRQQLLDAICKQNDWTEDADRETVEPDVALVLKVLGFK